MIVKSAYWEIILNREWPVCEAYLTEQENRLHALQAKDILALPMADQEKHFRQVKFLEDLTGKFRLLMNMTSGILESLANENQDLNRQLLTLKSANHFLLAIIPKLKLKLEPPNQNLLKAPYNTSIARMIDKNPALNMLIQKFDLEIK
jgi:hypothetical protein